MRMSDWSSDVCSSDLQNEVRLYLRVLHHAVQRRVQFLDHGGRRTGWCRDVVDGESLKARQRLGNGRNIRRAGAALQGPYTQCAYLARFYFRQLSAERVDGHVHLAAAHTIPRCTHSSTTNVNYGVDVLIF